MMTAWWQRGQDTTEELIKIIYGKPFNWKHTNGSPQLLSIFQKDKVSESIGLAS